MKTTILIAMLCAMAIPTLAQPPTEVAPDNSARPASGAEFKQERKEWRASKRIPYRHDFRLGVGWGAMSGNMYWQTAADNHASISPNVYLYYGYRAVAGLKVSLTLGYNRSWHSWSEEIYTPVDPSQGNTYFPPIDPTYMSDNRDNIRISPAVQYEWFNRGIVTLYSDIGFTWILPVNKRGEHSDYPKSGYIMPNLTPIGMTIGGKNWFGHIELFSLGARGLFNAGVGYRF